MNHEQLYDKIEAYLKGELSQEEKAAIEKELQTNPALALEHQWQQADLDAMETLLENDLRSKVNQWLADDEPPATPQMPAPSPSRASRLWAIVLLGAAIVLVIALWRMEWWKSGRPADPHHMPAQSEESGQQAPEPAEKPAPSSAPADKPEPRSEPIDTQTGHKIMAWASRQFEEVYATDDNMRGDAVGTAPSPLADAIAAYRQQQYRQALEMLNKIPSGSGYDIQSLELKAHALYHLKNYREGAAAFAEVASKGLSPYMERAQWNQLMCYAAQYPATQSDFRALLMTLLADSGHAYHQQALELQKQLPQ